MFSQDMFRPDAKPKDIHRDLQQIFKGVKERNPEYATKFSARDERTDPATDKVTYMDQEVGDIMTTQWPPITKPPIQYRERHRYKDNGWNNPLLILYTTEECGLYKPMCLSGDDLHMLLAFLEYADVGDVPVIQDEPLVIFINSLGYEFDCILPVFKKENNLTQQRLFHDK